MQQCSIKRQFKYKLGKQPTPSLKLFYRSRNVSPINIEFRVLKDQIISWNKHICKVNPLDSYSNRFFTQVIVTILYMCSLNVKNCCTSLHVIVTRDLCSVYILWYVFSKLPLIKRIWQHRDCVYLCISLFHLSVNNFNSRAIKKRSMKIEWFNLYQMKTFIASSHPCRSERR